MRKILTLFMAALPLAGTSANEPGETRTCSQDEYVCITALQQEFRVSFTAQNTTPLPVTLSINLTADNMQASQAGPLTFSLQGEESRQLLELAVLDPEQSWHFNYDFDYMAGSADAVPESAYAYALPFQKARAYPVIRDTGGDDAASEDARYGVDFKMPQGTTVTAAREGTVVEVVNDYNKEGPELPLKRKGNYVLIAHSDGTLGRYAHLKFNGALVKIGDAVTRGQPIALSGNTGFSGGPHLHFDVFKAVDGHRIETLPIRFDTAQGVVERLEPGKAYTAR